MRLWFRRKTVPAREITNNDTLVRLSIGYMVIPSGLPDSVKEAYIRIAAELGYTVIVDEV